MKKNKLWIVLAALIIPVLARGLWADRGMSKQHRIDTPNHHALTNSRPLLPPPDPAEADGKDIKQTDGVVLLDFAHTNQYQVSETSALREAIEKCGGRVETVKDIDSLESKLKYASAYVVISPSVAFNAEDVRAVQAFVERGGRLLVFTDATHGLLYYDLNAGDTTGVYPDITAANPLLAPFGITINNDYLYSSDIEEHEGSLRGVFFDKFGTNELTSGLKQVALYGTHSVKSLSGLILLRGTESIRSSIDDAYHPTEGSAVLGENGNVLAFGNFTFLTSRYKDVVDNATLIANLADFALGGKKTPALANFPYIFTKPVVQFYPSSKVKLTARMISSISKLQQSLHSLNFSIEIANEAPRNGDALILGTFAPSDDLLSFVKPFNIELDNLSEYIAVPKLGNVGRSGNGLLLLNLSKTGNTLTLLADSPEDLISLLDAVSSGSLYGCVLQSNVGICSVGLGGSYSMDAGAGRMVPRSI